MGDKDIPALLDKVTEVSGNAKVTYIGYSQGTSQIFYGLATQNPTYSAKLDRVIMLAPCLYIVFGINDWATYNAVFPVFEKQKLYAMGLPTWQADKKRVCDDPNGTAACTYLNYMPPNIETTPVGSLKVYSQLWLSGDAPGVNPRFQELMSDFSETNKEGTLVSPGLGDIEVPVQMVPGVKDTSCLLDTAAMLRAEMGDKVVSYTEMPEWGHMEFQTAIATPEYLQMIESQLAVQFDSAIAISASSAILAAFAAMSF